MERRSFFERYRPTNLSVDPLPLKVLNHTIWEAEMLGHVLDWASQYLHQKSCPSYLISPLLGKILEEVSKADLSDCYSKQTAASMVLDADEVDADVVHNVSYQPLKLMQSVTSKVDDICLRYKEENDQIETDFPIETTDGGSAHIFGASYFSIKNSRRTLEDRMVILPEINKVFNLKSPAHYFAVFDGHNGVEAAAYSAAHLHRHLCTSPDFPTDYLAAINYAFETTDTALLMKCKDEGIRSGTTAVVALIVPGNIYVAWAGDSQAVIIRNAEPTNLVSSHKPDREDELRRIKSTGGEVISIGGTWRVNGNLAVSRAIGNLDYKEYVTSTPEISQIETNGSEEFLILACDGLWDVVSPQRCVEVIRNSLLSENPSDIDSVSQKLVVEAKQSGSGDNITVIVVLLKPKDDLIKLYSEEKPEKMNGSVEAPVSPTKLAPVPKSPSTTNSVAPKVASSASPIKGSPASKTTGTVNRSPLGLRNPPVSKTPVKSTERRPPTKAPVPTTKPGVAAPKTVKDGVAASAKPAPSKTTVGAISRTHLASKTAATTKKPLKTEETEKPVTTKTVVPPRPRPGTVPLSSRLTSTTTKTATKVDANKSGDSSAPTVKESTVTKRSVLNSARSTASKEGNVSSRVTQVRQPPAAATAKPRVPSATTTTARPASGIQAAKPSASSTTVAKKTVTSTTTAATTRPPIKKPLGTGPVKKDVGKLNGQPPVAPKLDKKVPPIRSKAQEAAAAAKTNGAATVGEIAAAKGLAEISASQMNGVEHVEAEKKVELEIPKEDEMTSSVEAPAVAAKADVAESSIISEQLVKEAGPIVDTNENTLNIDATLPEKEIGGETKETLENEAEGPAVESIDNESNTLSAAPIKDLALELAVTASVVSSELENLIESPEIGPVSTSSTTDEKDVESLVPANDAAGVMEANNVGQDEANKLEGVENISENPVVNEVSAASEVLPEEQKNSTDLVAEVVDEKVEDEIIPIEPEAVTKTVIETLQAEVAKADEIDEIQLSSDESRVTPDQFQNDANVFNGEFTGYVENFGVTKSPEVAENEVEVGTAEPLLKSEVLASTANEIVEDNIEESNANLSAEVPETVEVSPFEAEIESQPDIRSSSADLPVTQVDLDRDDQNFLAEDSRPAGDISSEEIMVSPTPTQDQGVIEHKTACLTEDNEQDSAAVEGQPCAVIEEERPTIVEEQSPAVIEQLVVEQQPTFVEQQQHIAVEEEQPKIVEEEQPKIVEEEQRSVFEEEQPTIVEQEQTTIVEQEQPIVVGEAQPADTEEQQLFDIGEQQSALIDEQKSAVIPEQQSTVIEELLSAVTEDINFNYEQGLPQGKEATVENTEVDEDRASPYDENISTNENALGSNRTDENEFLLDEQSSIPNNKFEQHGEELLSNLVQDNAFSDPSFVSTSAGNVYDAFNQPSGYPEEIESNVDEEPEDIEIGVTVDATEDQRIAEEQARGSDDCIPETALDQNSTLNASFQSFENIDSEYGQNFLNESQRPLLDCSTAESNPESEVPPVEESNAILSGRLEEHVQDLDELRAQSPNQGSENFGRVDECKFEKSDHTVWSEKEVPLNPIVTENQAKVEPSESGLFYSNPFLEGRETDGRTGGTPFHLDVNAPEFTPSGFTPGFNFDAPAFNPSQGYQDVKGFSPGDDLADFNKGFGIGSVHEQSSVNDIFGTNGSYSKELDFSNNGPSDSANPFLIDTVNGGKLSEIKNEVGLGSQSPSDFQDTLLDINSPVPISELPPSSEVTNQGTRVDTLGNEAKDDFAIFNH